MSWTYLRDVYIELLSFNGFMSDVINDFFRKTGPVSRVYLAKDKESGASRGFAFVSFKERDDAESAFAKLQVNIRNWVSSRCIMVA